MTKTQKQPMKCYHTHPPLPITLGEKTVSILGGSCLFPAKHAALCDVFIGFEERPMLHSRRLPWIPGESFSYPIVNMKAPADPSEFFTLVAWTWRQLAYGQKVHVGCIGGHGRTGLFLAALVAHVTGQSDAIHYVRENYCDHAVETKVQFDFLAEYYGQKTEGLDVIYDDPKLTKEQIELAWETPE